MHQELLRQVGHHRARGLGMARFVSERMHAQPPHFLSSDVIVLRRLQRVMHAKASQEARRAVEFEAGILRAQDEVPIECVVEALVKANLTIRNLPGLIGDAAAKAKVAGLVDVAIRATEFCRDWRNRHIGHNDLKLAIGEPAKPLADASRKQVKDALKAIADVVNVPLALSLSSG